MNARPDTTTGSETPSPRDPNPIVVDMVALRRMPIYQLKDLYDALCTVDAVLSGLSCQPRFQLPGALPRLSAAGEVLDDLACFIGDYRAAVIETARQATPRNPGDAEERAWALIRYAADMTDGLGEFGELVERSVREVADSEVRK